MFLNWVFVLVAVLLTVLLTVLPVVLVGLSFVKNHYMSNSEAGSQRSFFFNQNGSTGALFSSSVSSQVFSDPEIGNS